MRIEAKLTPRIKLLSRIKVLHTVTRGLAEGFGCNRESINLIEKGILQQRIRYHHQVANFNIFVTTDGEAC